MAGLHTITTWAKGEGPRYGVVFAAHFAFVGAQLPFFSGYLEDRGFSAATIGALGAAALAFRVFAGPAIAFHVDGRAQTRGAIMFWALAVALPAAFLPWTQGFALAAASLLALCAYGALTPLIDAGALASDRRGALHYGQTRSWGSFAFIVAALGTGALVAKAGLIGSAYAMAASGVAALALSFALPHAPRAPHAAPSAAERRAEALDLIRSRTFLAYLAAAGLAQGAHAGYYVFTILDWRAQGIDPFLIGLLWATGTFSEIFLLMRGRGIARRFGPVKLMAAGALAAALRWALTALAPPLPVLFLVQALHAFTFGAVFLGSVEFIARATPPRLVNTAMTLMASTAVGVATGFAMFAGGFLYEWGGPPAMYALMSAMGLAAFAATLLLGRLWAAEKKSASG
jgi:PPP family 3-phenylpropionic acid transporter